MTMKENDLQRLIERSRSVKMTPSEVEQQRRSFAFGNTSIENDRVTRRVVDEQAEKLGSIKAPD
jgi:hypothetical protein